MYARYIKAETPGMPGSDVCEPVIDSTPRAGKLTGDSSIELISKGDDVFRKYHERRLI